jgi:hypothetical protein
MKHGADQDLVLNLFGLGPVSLLGTLGLLALSWTLCAEICRSGYSHIDLGSIPVEP